VVVLSSFELYRPSSLEDALVFLEKNAPDAKPMAGGTELLVLLRDRVIKPPRYIVDLSPLRRELSYVKVSGEYVKIGALTTIWELSRSFLHSDVRYAGFVDVFKKFGTMALRFEATIGGNIMTATQYSDYATLLLVYDARVKLLSTRGSRILSLEELLVDKRVTGAKPDELLVEVLFPEPPRSASSAFVKFDRREVLIAGVVTSATYLDLEGDVIRDVRVSFDMVREKRVPRRARVTEGFLRGKRFTDEVLFEASERVLSGEMERVTDWWTTAEYRLDMSKVALRRGLYKCYERIKRGVI
jgi:carbon-monoxide dehydrogenase medium subunit